MCLSHSSIIHNSTSDLTALCVLVSNCSKVTNHGHNKHCTTVQQITLHLIFVDLLQCSRIFCQSGKYHCHSQPSFDVGPCHHTGPSSAGPGPLPPPAGPPPGFAPGHLPPPSGPPPGMMMPRMPPPMMPPPAYAVLMPPPPGLRSPSCCCRRPCCCWCICLQAVWLNALYTSMYCVSICMQTCCTVCNPRHAAELSLPLLQLCN